MSATHRSQVSIPTDDLPRIINRLKRAEGQLAAVIRMAEEGRDCRDVITQLAATRKALDRAGFAMISGGLRQCQYESTTDHTEDLADLERLFLTLA